ncbi:DUF2795 domain-containing protein [Streptomyces sp. TRM70350]|uniref:DUF2795 domain-containing protein n=1 Tax=Streptomyces sp. TRM70350 TaxID=2856165 RepID=UPI001C48DD09|nr:DUF2795 domain-containing protein [Streptomyces sp. TRM70350]MBV7697448.1 DUF2795 domain-containing protein [Streptomyces sp. TRM70350]
MAEEVTRIEIADRLAGLFANGAVSKHDMLIAAADARPEVLEVLSALPDRRYTELRQVWEDLPRVPVGA